ncbi:MAG: citrate synthase, partial [Clostridia bacterium]|nr:citrate synthase [Clostridia bacterium]
MNEINYSEITPYVKKQAEISDKNNGITREMYIENDVKRGLRDLNGKGVVAGLTEVSHIKAKEIDKDGNEVPCEGELYYRGIDVKEITKGFLSENRHGFEETVYLLLFSKLPTYEELEEFKNVLSYYRTLPPSFVRDMILKAPGKNMMNIISRSVLALYAYDENPDDTSTANVLRQALQLIAQFPLLSVYGYQSFQHYHNNKSLFIHHPKPEYDTAENILYILRENGEFTPLEAKVLDTALVLHAEHGGGNNSTFTTHVVTSSATDTYSAISAALGSLKGPRHGGANVKVVEMFDDMKKCVDVKNKEEVRKYLIDVVEKNAFDKSGLIYGIGHAVYSKSDPRADVLHEVAKALSVEKGMEEEFKLYEYVEKIAP